MSPASVLVFLVLALPAAGTTPTRSPAPAVPDAAQADAAARAYCEAWKSGDFNRMKKLFLASRLPSLQEDSFAALARRIGVRCSSAPAAARLEPTADGASSVFAAPVRMTSNAASTTLYLTADGRVAFDPILIPHPGVILGRAILRLTSPDLVERSAGEAVLVNRSMPLMGYSAQAEQSRRDAAAAKLTQWWQGSQGEVGTGFPLSSEDIAFVAK